jgi:hypothetical protein
MAGAGAAASPGCARVHAAPHGPAKEGAAPETTGGGGGQFLTSAAEMERVAPLLRPDPSDPQPPRPQPPPPGAPLCHNFLIHSLVVGHLGCFQSLAIVNSAPVNISVQVSLLYSILHSFG